MDSETYHDFLVAVIAIIKDKAREAKIQKEKSHGSDLYDFNLGFLMSLHEIISLIQHQAQSFNIELEEIGINDIDPEKDLL